MGKINIEFLGVVGSTPVGSCDTYEKGGDSICAAIYGDDFLFLMDAGTGIRKAEKFYEHAKKIKHPVRIFLSHLHLDHYSGLPFCQLIYKDEINFEIVGPDNEQSTFAKSLRQALSPPYFPINFCDQKNLKFISIKNEEFVLNKIKIIPLNMFHPGGSLGWKFIFPNNKTIVFVSDNEPTEDVSEREKLLKWISGADLFIHDAQFTTLEYEKRKGWGHSPYIYPIELAKAACVKNVVLYHHNPMRNRAGWENYKENAQKHAKSLEVDLKIAESDQKIEI